MQALPTDASIVPAAAAAAAADVASDASTDLDSFASSDDITLFTSRYNED